jgi:hypothetical protein
MQTIDASTFQRDFGRYQEAAQGEPIQVTSDGRVVGVFMSLQDHEHYQRLKQRERHVYVAGEIPDDVIEAIENAQYLKPAD